MIPLEAICDKRLSPRQYRVLSALYSFLNPKIGPVVICKREAIAARAGIHASHVSACTAALVKLGYIVKAGTGAKSQPSVYTLLAGYAKTDQGPYAKTDQGTNKQTFYNKPNKQIGNGNDQAMGSGLALPDRLHPEAWEQFVAHRKAIKSPLTPQAMKLAISKLDELRKQGHDPREVIEQTIFNGWKGLFPIKAKQATAGHRLSEKELLRLGEELGIYARPSETWRDYAARINAARERAH